MLNVNVNIANLFFAEMGWHEAHSDYHRINKDAIEIMREEADDRAFFDVPAHQLGAVRNEIFVR